MHRGISPFCAPDGRVWHACKIFIARRKVFARTHHDLGDAPTSSLSADGFSREQTSSPDAPTPPGCRSGVSIQCRRESTRPQAQDFSRMLHYAFSPGPAGRFVGNAFPTRKPSALQYPAGVIGSQSLLGTWPSPLGSAARAKSVCRPLQPWRP